MAHTEETKRKIKKAWEKRRLTFIPPMKGKKMSEESRRRMSEAHKGKVKSWMSRPRTVEERKKISESLRKSSKVARGQACHSYRDGEVSKRRDQRFSMLYKRWRFDVFARDRFTCQHCGDSQGGNLVAHHIKSFSDYTELRFDLSNGVTICKKCHAKLHAKKKV